MVDLRKNIVCNLPHFLVGVYILCFFWFSYTKHFETFFFLYDGLETVLWILVMIDFVLNSKYYNQYQKRSVCTIILIAALNLTEQKFIKSNYYNIYLMLLVVWFGSILQAYYYGKDKEYLWLVFKTNANPKK